jgi:hypothetical protein
MEGLLIQAWWGFWTGPAVEPFGVRGLGLIEYPLALLEDFVVPAGVQVGGPEVRLSSTCSGNES